jgi:hypothetical protein
MPLVEEATNAVAKNEIRAHWIVQVMPETGNVARQERNNSQLSEISYEVPGLADNRMPNLRSGQDPLRTGSVEAGREIGWVFGRTVVGGSARIIPSHRIYWVSRS